MLELSSSGSVRGCPAMAIPTAILGGLRTFAPDFCASFAIVSATLAPIFTTGAYSSWRRRAARRTY